MTQGPDEDIDLCAAALLIAAEEYPDLQTDVYLGRIADMGRVAKQRIGGLTSAESQLKKLNAFLFDELGFQGNETDYYDPRNSFLNDVLDRRLGIPITLSLLYIEVGGRAGVPLAGVGMPGHFLVKAVATADQFIDAFAHGSMLNSHDCANKFKAAHLGSVTFRPDFLATVSKRQFLYRMLGNLRGIYISRNDLSRALAAVERMMMLDGDSPPLIRDRGMLLARMDRPLEATQALERYVALASDSKDAKQVEELIGRLWLRMAGLE